MHKNLQPITITVGIPTFNEGINIRTLLQAILKQKQEDIQVQEIIIVDDSTTEETYIEIKKFIDPRIRVIRRNKRLGQTSAQNEIFALAKTDVVVLFEADTYPREDTYLEQIVQPFRKNALVGLVQGNMVPLPSTSYLGMVLNTHFAIFTKFVIENKKFTTPITSGRGGRAFCKAVYTKLRWPKDVPDDDYAAVWCLSQKFTFVFQRNAHCYYQRPQVFHDFMQERQKISTVEHSIRENFSAEVIDSYFQVPFSTKGIMLIYFMMRFPIQFMYYVMLILLEKMLIKKGTFTDFWSQTKSTKKLQKK